MNNTGTFSEFKDFGGGVCINIDGIINGKDCGFSYRISRHDFNTCQRLFGDSREDVIRKVKEILTEFYLKAANYVQ